MQRANGERQKTEQDKGTRWYSLPIEGPETTLQRECSEECAQGTHEQAAVDFFWGSGLELGDETSRTLDMGELQVSHRIGRDKPSFPGVGFGRWAPLTALTALTAFSNNGWLFASSEVEAQLWPRRSGTQYTQSRTRTRLQCAQRADRRPSRVGLHSLAGHLQSTVCKHAVPPLS